jgi:hypothetical protein
MCELREFPIESLSPTSVFSYSCNMFQLYMYHVSSTRVPMNAIFSLSNSYASQNLQVHRVHHHARLIRTDERLLFRGTTSS